MHRAVIALFAAIAGTAAAADLVPLAGHVLPALSEPNVQVVARDKSRATSDEPVTLTIVLRREHEAAFQAFLAELYDPASPSFRQYLTPVEVSDRYGPSIESYVAVRAYFESRGFVLSEGSSNRMTLTMRGTRAQAEAALSTPIVYYRIGDKAFRANAEAPKLPAEIAWRVQAVVGLSTLARPRSLTQAIDNYVYGPDWHFYEPPPPDDPPPPPPDACDDTCDNRTPNDGCGAYGWCLDSPNPFGPGPLRVKAGNPVWPTVIGTGQRIGIVAFDRYDPGDIADYFTFVGRPALAASVSRVAVNGGAAAGADASEVLLDIVTSLMIARGAQVVVYDAPFAGGGTSFQSILNAMIGGGVTVITNSWAYCEDQTTLADVQSIDALFATAAASGISAFNASGDMGSTCLDGAPNVAHVPASSPHATAVGGSSLVTGPGPTYVSETWWNGVAGTPPTGQGGFGASTFFARPAWQDALVAGPMRSVPDVVANADPARGIFICQAANGGCPSGLLYGGTSMSAPMWAAFTAMLNEAQGVNLGHLNPAIYPLAGTSAFHDAAALSTDVAHVGLGSPRLNALSLALRGASAGPIDAGTSTVAYVGKVESGAVFSTWPYVSADGLAQAIVAVRLRDADGNPIPGKTVSLAASAGSSAIVSPPSAVTDTENGVALFRVTDLAVENVTMTATDATDAVVVDDQATVRFVVPVAAAASIAASPTTVLNDGVAATTIVVTLKDVLGRPTPGKLVVLSQGSGRSVVAGPSPSRTDAAGTITFTATNTHAETVTYAALDKSDRLPVPGSVAVDFTGQATASCVTSLPTAAPGFALTPWSNGYAAAAFNYSFIDFGCAGASNPVFDAEGSAYVTSFTDGKMFRLPATGGAASSGFLLATHGPTLSQPVFGKDGRLYAARGATGANAFSGAILELDPDDGSIVRTLVSGAWCPQGLAVDPLSGDLFYNGTCFGSPAEPRIFRISNPATSATVSTYATMPGPPSGFLAFAPNGTLYVQSNYLDPSPKVQRITGTDKPQPATVAQVPGLTSIFWLTIAETLPSGEAKSLIVLQPSGLRLADITTNPPTYTDLTVGGAASGTVGPDGCLYFSATEVIYRLSKADGTCGFDAANALPALKLAPSVVATSPQQGETLAFTATFENLAVPMGTPVTLVAVGANGQTRLGTTDAAGAVTIPLVGKRAGSDVVFAVAEIGDTAYFSNEVSVVWSPGKHATFLTAALSPGSGIAGVAATLRATLVDVSIVPNAPIAGATIAFTLGVLACNGVTDAQGAASCNIVPTGTGTPALTASFAGDASFLPSSATQGFHTLAAPDPACFTGLLPGGGTASACVAGASGCQFTSAAFVSTAGVGAPLPADVSVPYGLFQFVATGCGASATLTLTYPGALPPSATYWKFGPTSASPAHWYSLPAQVAGNTMTVTLVDGGAGDSDLAANGTIVDPGGAGVLAAIAAPSVPVPALDRGALAILSALLLLAVARRRRR